MNIHSRLWFQAKRLGAVIISRQVVQRTPYFFRLHQIFLQTFFCKAGMMATPKMSNCKQHANNSCSCCWLSQTWCLPHHLLETHGSEIAAGASKTVWLQGIWRNGWGQVLTAPESKEVKTSSYFLDIWFQRHFADGNDGNSSSGARTFVFLFVYKGNEEALLAILVKRIANETSTSLSLANSPMDHWLKLPAKLAANIRPLRSMQLLGGQIFKRRILMMLLHGWNFEILESWGFARPGVVIMSKLAAPLRVLQWSNMTVQLATSIGKGTCVSVRVVKLSWDLPSKLGHFVRWNLKFERLQDSTCEPDQFERFVRGWSSMKKAWWLGKHPQVNCVGLLRAAS